MNIMFIIPSLSGGGAERVTTILATALCKNDNVYIVSYFDSSARYSFDERIKTMCLDISDGKTKIAKYKNSLRRIIALKKLKKKYKIDYSISMLFSPNFENVMSKNSDKAIVSVRSKCSIPLSGLSAKINEFTCKKADLVVSLSKNVMHDLIQNFYIPPNQIQTIYNPCDIEFISRKSAERISESRFIDIRQKADFMVITAGRLTEPKGQWHLIRAFKKVTEFNSNVVLVILGKGELKEYLQQLIKELSLENNVFLLGFHSNPYNYLTKADLFAFTSIYEGFGNILLEAMACGLPIVSSDCDAGPRELLAPNTNTFSFATDIQYEEYGVLTEVMDGKHYDAKDPLTCQEIKFAEAIISLIKDPELLEHYKMRSQERIQDFSLNSIIKEWERILPPK